jgi:hypothetical protein
MKPSKQVHLRGLRIKLFSIGQILRESFIPVVRLIETVARNDRMTRIVPLGHVETLSSRAYEDRPVFVDHLNPAAPFFRFHFPQTRPHEGDPKYFVDAV